MEVGHRCADEEEETRRSWNGPRHSPHWAFPQEGANEGKFQAAKTCRDSPSWELTTKERSFPENIEVPELHAKIEEKSQLEIHSEE